jgi:hypothetical protein
MAKNGKNGGGLAWPAIVLPVVAAGAAAAWFLRNEDMSSLKRKATNLRDKATDLGSRLMSDVEDATSSRPKRRGGRGTRATRGARGGRGRTGTRTRSRSRSRTGSSASGSND